MNGLRLEYQDRVNFVILDWDIPADHQFGMRLGFTYHPNFAAIPANSDDVAERLFAAPRTGELRAMIERLLGDRGGG